MNPELDFEKRFRLLREIIETAVLTILMFLVIRFAIQNFTVDGYSMEPNLHNKELILVDRWTYLMRTPTRGDVIVFDAPPQPGTDYVKRIIGIPGDVITIQGTTVIVDGVTLKETYIAAIDQGVVPGARVITNLVVPANEYFVLGDNRKISSDSRIWGFVPRANIVGRAAFIYWPLGQGNNGFLSNVSDIFARVHQPGTAVITPPANGPGALNLDELIILVPGVLLLFQRRRAR